MKFFRKFNTTAEYDQYAQSQGFERPNLSLCVEGRVVKSTYYECESGSTYYPISVTYADEVTKQDTSNVVTINYLLIEMNNDCTSTETNGTDTYTVTFDANPSSSPRTISGSFVWHDNTIEYSFEQQGDVCESGITYTVTSVTCPSIVDYSATTANVILNWQCVEVSTSCTQTVSTGSVEQSVSFTENPWDEDRIVSGTISWCGTTAEYTFEQGWDGVKKFFDVTYVVSSTSANNICVSGVDISNVFSEMYVGELDTNYSTVEPTIVEDGYKKWTPTKNIQSSFTFSHSGDILVRYKLKNGVTKIADGMFSKGDPVSNTRCCSIRALSFPSGLGEIGTTGSGGGKVFMGQILLSSVTYPQQSSLSAMSKAAFHSCESLTSMNNIPDTVTRFGSSGANTSGQTFNKCISLTSFTLPSSTTTVGGGMVAGCNNLKWVKCLSPTPFPITTNTWADTWNGATESIWFKIYVPDDSYTAYTTATNWSIYASSIYRLSDFVDE